MATEFEKRNISDAENRLRLLLCVNALGLCSREELWPFVAGLELMEYMPMCLYLDELLGDKSLGEGRHAAQGLLFVTSGGREALRLFGRRTPQSDRERIQKEGARYAVLLREKRQLRTAFERAAPGRYRAVCSVTEGELPTLFLRVDAGSARMSQTAVRRFRENAVAILTRLYSLPPQPPSERVRIPEPQTASGFEKMMRLAEGEAPALYPAGERETAAAVKLREGDTLFLIGITLNGEEDAREWIQKALLNRSLPGFLWEQLLEEAPDE